MANRYDKYIDIEFVYTDNGSAARLMYTGYEDAHNLLCCKCEKHLRKGHFFTSSEDESQWVFGAECVKWVFGAGLKRIKRRR